MPAPPPPRVCANCGASIPPGARACPACGADERTGWRETSVYDGLDLPDAASDGDSGRGTPARRARRWAWTAAGLALILAMVLWALFGR